MTWRSCIIGDMAKIKIEINPDLHERLLLAFIQHRSRNHRTTYKPWINKKARERAAWLPRHRARPFTRWAEQTFGMRIFRISIPTVLYAGSYTYFSNENQAMMFRLKGTTDAIEARLRELQEQFGP